MIVNLENDLLLQIQQGNINAFEKIYFNLQPRLYAYSRKYIADNEIARDIVQEIFFEFWENRHQIIIKTSLTAYFFRILQNKCLNHIRDKKVQDKYSSYIDFKYKEAELSFFDHDSYKSIFFKEVKEIFEKSINELPESCREIFILSRIRGFSNKEIAEKLDISVRTVENQIYRALKTLKINLRDYLVFFPFFFSPFL